MSEKIAEVYASPQMIGLMENACAELVYPYLEPGQSTVGILVNVSHMAATPVGFKVRAEAELLEIDGKRLVFAVTAYDNLEKIGEGRHERFIIDTERFMSRVAKKATSEH
jgi:predicted thioesterase